MGTSEIEWEDGMVISQNQISDFENILGINLPNDFKEVVKNQDGASPNHPALDFCGMKEKVFSGLIPLLEPNYYSASIVETINSYEIPFPEGIIPFGQDPFGNLYCFDYRGKVEPTIVYWDHEAEMSYEFQFCLVADTFSAFLNKLYIPDDE